MRCNDKSKQLPPNSFFDRARRQWLQALGGLGGGGLALAWLRTEEVQAAAAGSCTIAPAQTEGPYWVDDGGNRSNLTSGTSRASVVNGLALALTIKVTDNLCAAAANVRVDVWHCDTLGVYSDVSGGAGQTENTSGQNWLRGWQVSDANGEVNFLTIYPGWYTGRTVHIHVRARAYDSSGKVIYNFTTQLYFDPTVTNTVYTQSPYSSRRTPDTTNASDPWIGSGSTVMMPTVRSGGGYQASITLGLSDLPASRAVPPSSSTTTSGNSGSGGFDATATATGSPSSLTLTASLSLPAKDVGSSGSLFLGIRLANLWYFHDGHGWTRYSGGNPPAYWSGTLTASHGIEVARATSVETLCGSPVYVGYGRTADAMLLDGTYKLVHTLCQ